MAARAGTPVGRSGTGLLVSAPRHRVPAAELLWSTGLRRTAPPGTDLSAGRLATERAGRLSRRTTTARLGTVRTVRRRGTTTTDLTARRLTTERTGRLSRRTTAARLHTVSAIGTRRTTTTRLTTERAARLHGGTAATGLGAVGTAGRAIGPGGTTATRLGAVRTIGTRGTTTTNLTARRLTTERTGRLTRGTTTTRFHTVSTIGPGGTTTARLRTVSTIGPGGTTTTNLTARRLTTERAARLRGGTTAAGLSTVRTVRAHGGTTATGRIAERTGRAASATGLVVGGVRATTEGRGLRSCRTPAAGFATELTALSAHPGRGTPAPDVTTDRFATEGHATVRARRTPAAGDTGSTRASVRAAERNATRACRAVGRAAVGPGRTPATGTGRAVGAAEGTGGRALAGPRPRCWCAGTEAPGRVLTTARVRSALLGPRSAGAGRTRTGDTGTAGEARPAVRHTAGVLVRRQVGCRGEAGAGRERGSPVAQVDVRLLGRAEVVEPADLLTGDHFLRRGRRLPVGRAGAAPAPPAAALLAAGLLAVVRSVRTPCPHATTLSVLTDTRSATEVLPATAVPPCASSPARSCPDRRDPVPYPCAAWLARVPYRSAGQRSG
ncbi:hypothetical protein ACIA8K_04245 [Catenuloplanes sp. NPDC051500]|uniref:hypothetical protein n=1 Tax=Catenuloplanes sp. NPDC051500 TaxID=3363959 RepID=UPI0037B54509